ncbi:unnamed protein product, partial [Sphacelaria rigidula]
VEGSNTVIVLGVTNRPAEVDPAILRRLSRQFEIGLPTTVDARREILSIMTSGFNLHANVCLEYVARHTERYSGSDLHALCQAAQTLSAREFAQALRAQRSSAAAEAAN